jgi:sigma-B regulation protein RsbU (phosphoserine phosphatase)
MNSANKRWVVPRIAPEGSLEGGLPLALHATSYALASIGGTFIAAIVLRFTFVPGIFSSTRGVVIMSFFTILFVTLFLGLAYAASFRRRLVERVRDEESRKAREEQELRIAAEVQRALMPQGKRVSRAFEAAGAAIACKTIGGDFFDYFDLPDGRLGFALGDVAGKGPPAAILAAMVQGIFSSHVDDGFGPAGTIAAVNRVLAQRIIEGRFATIFYAVLTPEGRLLSCNAGNNPPLLVSADGTLRRLDRGGLPIGPFEDATYEEEEVQLRHGDTLVLYSDGVSDAADANDETYGDDRLAQALQEGRHLPPEGLLDHILGSVRHFSSDRPQFDDITVLVVRYEGA